VLVRVGNTYSREEELASEAPLGSSATVEAISTSLDLASTARNPAINEFKDVLTASRLPRLSDRDAHDQKHSGLKKLGL
jgi:hypothetical protein